MIWIMKNPKGDLIACLLDIKPLRKQIKAVKAETKANGGTCHLIDVDSIKLDISNDLKQEINNAKRIADEFEKLTSIVSKETLGTQHVKNCIESQKKAFIAVSKYINNRIQYALLNTRRNLTLH